MPPRRRYMLGGAARTAQVAIAADVFRMAENAVEELGSGAVVVRGEYNVVASVGGEITVVEGNGNVVSSSAAAAAAAASESVDESSSDDEQDELPPILRRMVGNSTMLIGDGFVLRGGAVTRDIGTGRGMSTCVDKPKCTRPQYVGPGGMTKRDDESVYVHASSATFDTNNRINGICMGPHMKVRGDPDYCNRLIVEELNPAIVRAIEQETRGDGRLTKRANPCTKKDEERDSKKARNGGKSEEE